MGLAVVLSAWSGTIRSEKEVSRLTASDVCDGSAIVHSKVVGKHHITIFVARIAFGEQSLALFPPSSGAREFSGTGIEMFLEKVQA